MLRKILTGHVCAQAGCEQDATHVVIETHPLAMLARSGALLVCEKHAVAYEAVGGAACSLDGFVKTAADEHQEAGDA